MKCIFAIIFLFLLILSSFGQNGEYFIDSVDQTIANIKEDIVKIKEGYYVIQPEGLAGNISVYVGNEGIVLVDDQWSKLAPKIMDLLAAVSRKPIKYIINSHYHFDHVDGNKAFGPLHIPIIAHKNLRVRLSEGDTISGSG